MPYIIVRSDGAYVTRPGTPASYTRDLTRAWVIPSREEAERNRCPGNETVRACSEVWP